MNHDVAKKLVGVKVSPIDENNELVTITLVNSRQKYTNGKWYLFTEIEGVHCCVMCDYKSKMLDYLIRAFTSKSRIE